MNKEGGRGVNPAHTRKSISSGHKQGGVGVRTGGCRGEKSSLNQQQKGGSLKAQAD